MTPPAPLSENAGLAFIGEQPWAPAVLTSVQAEAIASARNPTGRPNSDVLRRYVGVRSGRRHERWQVDFPLHFTAQEAALYLKPSRRLHGAARDTSARGWLNPHAQPHLRPALSRLERYLATPHAAPEPAWDWIDSTRLPDDSLLAVARDDDFAHGLLASRLFRLWWRGFSGQLAPAQRVASFPFPWPPATLLSALSRTQEEQRLALAHAARGNDRERLDAAAAAAYGWPRDLPDDELLARLVAANGQRTSART